MHHYELVVILSPLLNQDQNTENWDRIKGFITTRNGNISHEERWGTRRLAYSIHKGQNRFMEGSYHLTRFSTERPFNNELESLLKVEDQVLRYLLVVSGPPKQAPAEPEIPEKPEIVPVLAETEESVIEPKTIVETPDVLVAEETASPPKARRKRTPSLVAEESAIEPKTVVETPDVLVAKETTSPPKARRKRTPSPKGAQDGSKANLGEPKTEQK